MPLSPRSSASTITVSDAQGYWDNGRTHRPTGVPLYSPQLGTTILGTDGHAWTFAKASAAVASSGTVVILTEPAMTFATGAGAYTTRTAAHAIGDVAWLQKTLI